MTFEVTITKKIKLYLFYKFLFQIKKSLCALIKYGLVTFESSKNGVVAEYSLHKENILCLLRYPKYILLIKNRYGEEAEMILEEILQQGSVAPSKIILNIMNKTRDDKVCFESTVLTR